MEQYILAIDAGTTSMRTILFDKHYQIKAIAQKEFTQYFTKPGWVEHDATEIWLSLLACFGELIVKAKIKPEQVKGIGITNQRETAVIWNKETSLPICKAIVWQSRQTVEICDDLIRKGYDELFRKKCGLRIDPYFSATKFRWMLDHVEGAKQQAEEGLLLAGTIDSWLVWCLTGGKVHVTDYSNASRTLLYNIYDLCWDEQLCQILNIPMQMLPEVKDSSCIYGYTSSYNFFSQQVAIAGIAGDQQAALFGQNCYKEGDAKNTYGTGCFLLMNTGHKPVTNNAGLLTTIAWGYKGEITYALEGSIFVAGSAIQWLRDQMHFFDNSIESEAFAKSVKEDSGVMVVPAFVGLGAPYWDDKCRGAILGITRGTTQQDITKATLDSLCYQTRDVLQMMCEISNVSFTSLRVDGGASANHYLMQTQADILQCVIDRPSCIESTALGAAKLAGLALGFYTMNPQNEQAHTYFSPKMTKEEANQMYDRWKKAIEAVRCFK